MMLYRVFTFVINFFAVMIGVSALFSFGLIASAPGALIAVFLLIGVLIYTWYANVFQRKVLVKQGTITKKEREWMVVNGIIAIVFCVLTLASIITVLLDPKILEEVSKNFLAASSASEETTMNAMNSTIKFMGFCTGILLLHIIWTFILLRKHKDKVVSN